MTSLQILAVLLAVAALALRFTGIAVLIAAMRVFRRFSKGVVEILTWGGLRGGISIALALSLPPLPHKDLILTATYMVVAFSILVQGLTVGRVVRVRGQAPHRQLPEIPHA